jgi:ubiquitin thioesterase protein OTUB1
LERFVPSSHTLITPADTITIAVAFSYFEALVRIGDPHKFLVEETRLKSLRNILNDAGFQEHLYEDFAEDTIDLLRETSSAADGGATLLQTFNDTNRSMSVITYLKVRRGWTRLLRFL